MIFFDKELKQETFPIIINPQKNIIKKSLAFKQIES